MIWKSLSRVGGHTCRLILLASLLLVSANCRRTIIYITPEEPQQGELIWISVDNEERGEVDHVEVTFAGRTGRSSAVPAYFSIDTCKDTEPYLTSLEIRAVTTYVDGATGTQTLQVDLTRGLASREDDDQNYAVYVTQGLDESHRDDALDMANAFMDEFDSYSRSQFLWAEPSLYTSHCDRYANSADLIISIGHGSAHVFGTGDGNVDLSETGYGNFRPCGGHGDAEYLVFAACSVLSMADSDGHAWHYFWKNQRSTKSELRPFSGLHMVMGFRTNFATSGRDGDHLFEEFAANLDSGDRVVDAWQEAVGDELDFDDGDNRGAVFYLSEYVDDTIHSAKDDYIYGNSKYSLSMDYWD
jgi:hypothetical protein